MEIISHRGNLYRPIPKMENTLPYILKAMSYGFSVEFDIWWHHNNFWLGHDEPEEIFDIDNLIDGYEKLHDEQNYNGNLYVHCKTVTTLQKVFESHKFTWKKFIPFFHNNDECILLRNEKIWMHPRIFYWEFTYNDETFPKNTILVGLNQEHFETRWIDNIKKYAGACTDYPMEFKEFIL